jgi:hypothetical protein
MGTISDKLMRVINTKEDIRQALISKGYDVPTSIPFKEYAKMISDLPCKVDDFPKLPGDVTRWHFGGLTNEMMAAMDDPRIEDADHKGRFLSFKNFAWSGMSGCGGYSLSKETFSYTPDIYSFNFTDPEGGLKIFDVYFQLIGLEENSGVTFNLDIIESGTAKRIKRETYTKDGIYHFEYKSEDDAVRLYMIGYNGVGEDRTTFTVKILPYYAGALVFDGVDDYGICENFPILTKEKEYTVVALRQWIEEKNDSTALVSNCKNWGQDGAFLFEYNNLRINFLNVAISFGHVSSVDRGKSPFSYQTSKLYNGKNIEPGSFIGSNELVVGKGNKDFPTVSKVAIWELIILDHDATEEELTKIKNYFVKTYPWLFFDQAWTVTGKTNEDEDRATIANITGNGNNLVLSNFGFAEGSGYGLYKTPFELYPSVQHSSKYSLSFSKFALGDHNLIIAPKQNDLSYDIKVKVTGLKDGVKFKWGWIGTTGYIDITTDGIHMLNKPASQIRQLIVEFAEDFDPDHVVTIEQIPEYEGYLVTDGVDDKAVSKQFKFGENFTVILDFKFPVKKISYCGFDLSSKVRIQNLQGSGVYVVLKGNKTLIPSNVVRAVTSEGKVYDENWNEYNIVPGNISSNYTMVNLGFDGSNQFAESATKLAGIYSSALSKDDCIKAYNYLQTLKSK